MRFYHFYVKFASLLFIPEIKYIFARLMHHRLFYKRIHKQHHEWTAPIAVAALYCHPAEHILGNLMPPAIGPAVLRSHPLVIWAWFLIVAAKAPITHSGYHLPFTHSPEFHEYHHRA
jgi:fatty acid hydroxylase domain-containing protein 2